MKQLTKYFTQSLAFVSKNIGSVLRFQGSIIGIFELDIRHWWAIIDHTLKEESWKLGNSWFIQFTSGLTFCIANPFFKLYIF